MTAFVESRRGLLALLAMGGALGSLGIALRAPAAPESYSAILPGFTAEDGPDGLVVTSVRDGGRAERAGIAPGDLIVALDGRAVRRLRDAAAYLKKDKNDHVRLGLIHAAQRRDVLVERVES